MLSELQWKMVFLAGYLALFFIRWPFVAQGRRQAVASRHVDVQERILLAMMGIAWMLLPIVWVATPLFAWAEYATPEWVRWLGVLFSVGAVVMFWRSHVDLGRNWSTTLELRAEHALVEHGVYRRIRHPMYSAIWLWATAQLLLIPNWVVGPALMFAFFWMYLLRTPREEQMMRERFGQAYDDYMTRTGRILPRFW
jgi:protein-S-isoprenylcysteine O-methyltransferase Ste14